MKVIEELYYGIKCPYEEISKSIPSFSEYSAKLKEKTEKIKKTLSEEQFRLFSEYDKSLEELYQLLAKTDDPRAIAALFDDLCTRKELDNMAERLFAAKLLLEGNTYSQVMAQADISSATLSRVSRCVQYGEGYSKLLK